jgi:hypothetical protein
MKRLQQGSYGSIIWQSEVEIATKMGQMTSTCRTRTFFREIVGKLLELVSDIGGNITLFLDILIAPAQVILLFHRTR